MEIFWDILRCIEGQSKRFSRSSSSAARPSSSFPSRSANSSILAARSGSGYSPFSSQQGKCRMWRIDLPNSQPASRNLAYLPSPKKHALGGYETWLGTSNVQEDASEILTKNLLEMLVELRK